MCFILSTLGSKKKFSQFGPLSHFFFLHLNSHQDFEFFSSPVFWFPVSIWAISWCLFFLVSMTSYKFQPMENLWINPSFHIGKPYFKCCLTESYFFVSMTYYKFQSMDNIWINPFIGKISQVLFYFIHEFSCYLIMVFGMLSISRVVFFANLCLRCKVRSHWNLFFTLFFFFFLYSSALKVATWSWKWRIKIFEEKE